VGRLTEQETNGDLTRTIIHNSRRDPMTFIISVEMGTEIIDSKNNYYLMEQDS